MYHITVTLYQCETPTDPDFTWGQINSTYWGYFRSYLESHTVLVYTHNSIFFFLLVKQHIPSVTRKTDPNCCLVLTWKLIDIVSLIIELLIILRPFYNKFKSVKHHCWCLIHFILFLHNYWTKTVHSFISRPTEIFHSVGLHYEAFCLVRYNLMQTVKAKQCYGGTYLHLQVP